MKNRQVLHVSKEFPLEGNYISYEVGDDEVLFIGYDGSHCIVHLVDGEVVMVANPDYIRFGKEEKTSLYEVFEEFFEKIERLTEKINDCEAKEQD